MKYRMRLLLICLVGVLRRDMVLGQQCSARQCCDTQGSVETTTQDDTPADEAFSKDAVVPDVLSSAPGATLTVSYPAAEVNLGNKIYSIYTILILSIAYSDADGGKNYTIMIVDIDAPSRATPATRLGLVCLSVNVKGSSLSLYSDFIVAPYIPPTPLPGGGLHRYVALLYEQNDVIDTTKRALLELSVFRLYFNLNDFVGKFGLSGPVAANYWLSGVPECSDTYCCG